MEIQKIFYIKVNIHDFSSYSVDKELLDPDEFSVAYLLY